MIPNAPWYVCDLPGPADAAFRDSDYEIPASFTHGKSKITIRIERIPGSPDAGNQECNEYYYWVFCYGETPVPAF